MTARRMFSKCLRRPNSTRLNLEQFEHRIVPASTLVKSTADSGMDTLRAAILFANGSGATTITFDFPPGGPLLFTPATPLPALLNKTTFLTIPVTEKRVEISGAAAGPGTTGLTFMAGGYIEDVSITGWSGFGVSLMGGSTTITDSYIGTNHGGTVDKGNMGGGINIESSGNTVFLTTISGNEAVGITLKGPAAGGNTIFGNLIGVAGDGITAMENKGDGIYCEEAPGNLLGGSIGFGNTISGNSGSGIHIKGAGAMDNKIVGNKIGLGDDNSVVPNAFAGVFIEGAPSTTIGGADVSDKNFISANTLHGVAIFGPTAKGNLLRGNFIGVGLDETSDRGNEEIGVFIGGGASENFIGKPLAGHGNTIAFNGSSLGILGHGILIDSGTKNTISRNSIFLNAGRAIDLRKSPGVNDGITINDTYDSAVSTDGDPDTGANGLQDYPVVVARAAGAAHTGVHLWRLNSKPDTDYTIEFFENTVIDPSGSGEGKMYITSVTDKTDADGNLDIPYDHAGKTFVSATATDEDGNTSEFSLIDTDADGLADAWETAVGPVFKGMDLNEDGITDLDLYSLGARFDKRDLFVEVDAMENNLAIAAIKSGLAMTVDAFSKATAAAIHNPDGSKGILLHAELDEENVTKRAYPNTWTEYDQDKNGTGIGIDGRFGRAVDRGTIAVPNPNWVNIKAARQVVYRYCMIAEKYDTGESSGIAEGAVLSGATNDFMVTVTPGSWGSAADKDIAGSFMHELGHTLNLEHGGGDEIEYKPNYRSVMNYAWQVPNAIVRTEDPGLADYGPWKLDYSGEKLGPLDESKLNETIGLGGAEAFTLPYGGLNGTGDFIARLGKSAGPNDWDRDGDALDNPAQRDINFDGSDVGILTGHDDWSALNYYFVESRYFKGLHGVGHPNEMRTSLKPPRVQSVTINDGAAQRSRVTEVEITFNQHLTISFSLADAFVLTRQSGGQPNLVTNVDDSGATTVVTLTFLGTNAVDYGSLADGRYTLTIDAMKVYNGNGNLDGNANGTGGDNYVLASETDTMLPPTNIFRFFGDITGDGTVAINDFNLFRMAFGGTDNAFDFDNDGSVSNSDFNRFRSQFGGSI